MGGLAAIFLMLLAIVPTVLGLQGITRRSWGRVIWCLVSLAVLAWLTWRMMSGWQE